MKHDICWRFGLCWNEADFSSFSNKLINECTYTSFDFFYKLKGRDKLVEHITKEATANLASSDYDKINIHKGYYQKTSTLLKTIKECCIMVRNGDMKTMRILSINKRFGRVTSIVGYSPDEIKSIRDIKIRG